MGVIQEFQASAPDDIEQRLSPVDEAWLSAILMSIRSMRDAARWLLGVVVAWLFLVPQLTGLREWLPDALPLAVTVFATILLVGSVGLIVWSVLNVQALGMRSYEIQDLSPDDLAYLKDWGLLQRPPTPEQWRTTMQQNSRTLERYRYLTREDAQRFLESRQFWITENQLALPPLPHSGEALFAYDEILRMRREERNAMAVLSIRNMDARFQRAKWIILVGSFVAAAALLVLVGPPPST